MQTELRLLRQVRPYRPQFILGMVTSFLASVLDGTTVVVLIPLLRLLFGTSGQLGASGSAALTRFTEWLLNPLILGVPTSVAVARLLGVLVLGLVLRNLMAYSTAQLQVAVQEGLVRDLRAQIFEHLLKLDLGFFQRTRQGQLLASITTEVDQVKEVVTAALMKLFQSVVKIAVVLVLMSQISGRLMLLTLTAAPLLVFGLRFVLVRLRRHSRARTHDRAAITSTLTEQVGAVKLIRAYGEEERQLQKLVGQLSNYRDKVRRTQRYSSLTGPMSEIFGGLLIVLIIAAATQPALVGGVPLTPEAAIAFLVASLQLLSPIKSISQYPASMAVAMASAERVYALLDEPVSDVDAPGDVPARFERDIVFDHVSFRYGTETPVLSDISFRLEKGKVLAIVGPSGAGKTTLVDLLPRFNEPVGGRILLDGVPLGTIQRRSLRGILGVVSQDTVLLNDTVEANIAFGSPGATRAQVEAAAAAANAAEFVAGLPDGYDTVLGERGTRLSGGQRQRISIARALLRDPPILILDEATSALDTESERLVQEAIERLMKDRTVLVIAHRLATVRHADQILVLEAGRVVERGRHAELIERGGLYRRLHDLQFRDPVPAA
ncbi:MAG TPA: ABC transporter ATP-binding protein [Gemmatimonadales bacterium]|nr:ABC transporter ATP-binding protein [Gemmatimonadales bacterium]